MSKIHRTFHYNINTGETTPVEEVTLQDGSRVVVPVKLDKDGVKIDSKNSKSQEEKNNE